MRALGVAMMALTALSGCGPNPTGAASSSRSVAVTPSPSRQALIAVVRLGEVVLIDASGNTVASTQIRLPAPNGFVGIVGIGAGGRRAAYYDTDSGTLWALHPDGQVERLASMSTAYGDILLSPDGDQWAWSEGAFDGNGAYVSRLHLGSSSGDRVIQQLADPDHALRPYRWDQGGLLVESEAVGRMSIPVFDPPTGAVELVDPSTGTVQPLSLPPGCVFAGRASDGTIACDSQTSDGVAVTFIAPDGTSTSVTLPRLGFKVAGDVSFRPGVHPRDVALAGFNGDSAHPVFATRVIRVDSGAQQDLGPVGLAPAAGEDWVWLDGGQLVGMGWLTSSDADSGVWIISASGDGRRISSGSAYGVIYV